jgi:hypothetical protein
MNSIGFGITAAAALVILFGSARWALLSAVAGIFYLTLAQSIQVAGLTIYAFRILAMALFVRVTLRKELPSKLNSIDRYLLFAYLYVLGVFLIRAREDEGLAYQIGVVVDTFLWYFSFRSLLKGVDDLRWMLSRLCIVLAPYAVLVLAEALTSRNQFVILGGVDLASAHYGDMWFRDGRLRATGSFSHPSLLGTVAATFLALYLSLWLSGLGRSVGLIGAALCLAIVWATNSGGPLGCVAFVIAGWAVWPLRRSMRAVRIGTATVLVVLALSMAAPIWYLLGRLSAVTGGGGWHRGALLDIAFQNLDKWWLAGMPATETAAWLPTVNNFTGAVDLTNNFLALGVAAGLGAVSLMILLVVRCFREIGRALASTRGVQRADGQSMEVLTWGIGVLLATHIFNWFAITYWDQSNLIWLLHLAIVSSVSEQATADKSASESIPEVSEPEWRRELESYRP